MRTISTSSYCPISARSGGTTSSSTASTSSTAVSCEAKGLAYKFARFWALPSRRVWGLEMLAERTHRQRTQHSSRRVARWWRRSRIVRWWGDFGAAELGFSAEAGHAKARQAEAEHSPTYFQGNLFTIRDYVAAEAWAVDHLSERAAVFSHADLLAAALGAIRVVGRCDASGRAVHAIQQIQN